jgi:hypothetical protein
MNFIVTYFDHIHSLFLSYLPSTSLWSPFSSLIVPFYFYVLLDSTYERKHMLSFWVCQISLNMMISSSIHFPENVNILYFFVAN